MVTGHSMAETLTVALRVAEEAIEEAIAKAEEFRDSLVGCCFTFFFFLCSSLNFNIYLTNFPSHVLLLSV